MLINGKLFVLGYRGLETEDRKAGDRGPELKIVDTHLLLLT